MGKISDALKKVAQERERQKREQHVRIEQQIQAVQAQKTSGPLTRSSQSVEPGAATLKERIGNLRYEPVYIAKATDASGVDPRVVTHFDYDSAVSEQYRILRTNIKSYTLKNTKVSRASLNGSARAPKLFTITSSLHNEGKTVTSVNLAVALAKDLDNKVLLIDCDLRNGAVHQLLNVDVKPGLADLLSSDYDYSVGLHPTILKNLFVIPRGTSPKNPSELLGSKKMRMILESLRQEPLTYIIIDTPPIIPFTDAQVLGAQTDAVILAVQAYRTQSRIVQQAKDLIQHARGKFLGFVLTQTDYYMPDIHSYYYYYRYHKKPKDGRLKAGETLHLHKAHKQLTETVS